MKRVAFQLSLIRSLRKPFSASLVPFVVMSWSFIEFLILDFYIAHIVIEIRCGLGGPFKAIVSIDARIQGETPLTATWASCSTFAGSSSSNGTPSMIKASMHAERES